MTLRLSSPFSFCMSAMFYFRVNSITKEVAMKKFLTVCFALVLSLGLCACSSVNIDSVKDTAQSFLDNFKSEPEVVEKPPVIEVLNEHQAFWENVFAEGSLSTESNSLRITLGEDFVLSHTKDNQGAVYQTISGFVISDSELIKSSLEFYRPDIQTTYARKCTNVLGLTLDDWYLCAGKSQMTISGSEEMMQEFTGVDFIDSLNVDDIAASAGVSIQYIETVDGLDRVKLVFPEDYADPELASDSVTLLLDSLNVRLAGMELSLEGVPVKIEFNQIDDLSTMITPPETTKTMTMQEAEEKFTNLILIFAIGVFNSSDLATNA